MFLCAKTDYWMGVKLNGSKRVTRIMLLYVGLLLIDRTSKKKIRDSHQKKNPWPQSIWLINQVLEYPKWPTSLIPGSLWFLPGCRPQVAAEAPRFLLYQTWWLIACCLQWPIHWSEWPQTHPSAPRPGGDLQTARWRSTFQIQKHTNLFPCPIHICQERGSMKMPMAREPSASHLHSALQ